MFPLYVALFFVIIPIYKPLPKINFKFELPDINFDIKYHIQSHKHLCMAIQTVLSFGYIILHPFNGHFYPILAGLIIFFIILSIISSYINLYKKEKAELSIFAFIPLFILFFGNGYNFENITIDIFHEGEKLATWLMHSKFNLTYYKDISLVHGFCDIIPPLLGEKIFGENSLNAFFLGRSLFDNFILILTITFSYYIFKEYPILIFLSAFRAFNIPQLYILSYFFFLKSAFKIKPLVWVILYINFAYIALFFYIGHGNYWILASLPLAIYVFIKQPHKYISVILIGLIIYFNKDFIYYYLIESANYIQSNIFSFGNDFPLFKWQQIPSDCIKLFALLVVPYFIIKLFEEFKNKNVKNIFLLIFAILYVCLSTSYSLGRIDGILMLRIREISLSYLTVIIPLLFINSKAPKYVASIMAIYLIFMNSTTLNKWKSFNLKLQNNNEINSIFEKYPNADFLDLNSGANYFIFNKKMPIPYTSYFIMTNSKQSYKIAHVQPKIVLLKTYLNRFDNIYPSLRINPLYRNLVLNNEYSTFKTENNVFFIKNNKNNKDMYLLDKVLSTNNLEYLPDAWFNSINSLPVKNLNINYSLNGNIIKFDIPQNGKNIDLVELNTDNKDIEYTISINNSNSDLHFKSKQTSVLFPFDNFPSWLLNTDIKTITIKTNRPITIKSVKFYKRN